MDSAYKEYVTFTINESKEMAIFLAELTKQGIKFFVAKFGENYQITLTGF